METRLLTHEPLITWHLYPITRLPPPPLINYFRIPSNSNYYVSLCIGPLSQAWKLIQKQRQQKKQNKTKKGRGGCGGTLITSAQHPVGVFLLYTVCGYSTIWLASWGCLLWYVQQAEADCVPASHPPGLTQPLTCMIKGNREGGGG